MSMWDTESYREAVRARQPKARAELDWLYAIIEGNPHDCGPRYALADALDAVGETDLAHAWRWNIERGIGPHKFPPGTLMMSDGALNEHTKWGWRSAKLSELADGHGPLHRLAAAIVGTGKKYDSFCEAVESLAPVLALMRDTYALKLPGE